MQMGFYPSLGDGRSYVKSDEKAIAFQSDLGNTIYFSVAPALLQYVEKHKICNHTDFFIEIVPSFEYCDYLVELGKEFFKKLYADLK